MRVYLTLRQPYKAFAIFVPLRCILPAASPALAGSTFSCLFSTAKSPSWFRPWQTTQRNEERKGAMGRSARDVIARLRFVVTLGFAEKYQYKPAAQSREPVASRLRVGPVTTTHNLVLSQSRRNAGIPQSKPQRGIA
jgi:hypothetical protein